MSLQTGGFAAGAAEPTAPQVRALLNRAVGFPGLAEKYRGAADRRAADLRVLDPLSADELREAVWSGVRGGLAKDRGAVLYLGGGTTAEPSATLVPSCLFAGDILRAWSPLAPGDVLLNLSRGTRLWPVHDLCNALAALSGCSAIPYGTPDTDDLGRLVDFFEQCGATALAADSPTLRALLEHCRLTGRRPHWLRTLLWVGVGLDGATARLLAEVLPDIAVWGLYGSVETWAIGCNGPRCARDVFHPLPHQYVELVDGEILVSTLHELAVTPLVRYRTGDTGEFADCPCGAPQPGVRVRGRSADVLAFRGARFGRAELVALAASVEDVEAAEAEVFDAGLPTERLQLSVRTVAGAPSDRYLCDWVRECVLARHLTLRQAVAGAPDAFEVVAAAVRAD
ncbi:hypothetical protein [Kitasatospora sp. DSM 101779]|uniref:hypothetical protein n=1 Tax=Kitasatospora sp. DSM 101779 TaxID=2853165 RepID=UPI0021D8F044|nr:hypothetical protein [Kitasatospora sp. DSM 101779]MCU7821877.1 hypothetical protein [Kitasatospora sp. DSM 101779]